MQYSMNSGRKFRDFSLIFSALRHFTFYIIPLECYFIRSLTYKSVRHFLIIKGVLQMNKYSYKCIAFC